MQQDDTNCSVKMYIDNVLLGPTAGVKPTTAWAAMTQTWTPASGQTTVELKLSVSCVRGGNSNKMWIDMVTLALQP